MSLLSLLSHWRADASFAPNVTAWKRIPARVARHAPLPENLSPSLRQALHERGIPTLYAHQAQAWENIHQGHNTALVTGTASGKTLAYNLPVLDYLLKNPTGRALYLFPPKALAPDQLAEVEGLAHVTAAAYDGDTPGHTRPRVRANAQLIVTNPDMLHVGILPHHPQWEAFFSQLRFIVIDEMHVYRGVFGSHVANVIRRLKRVAAHYGACGLPGPQFILTSATIGNPQELAQTLIEEPVKIITEDGSAWGEKHFLIYNPPITDEKLGLRVGAQTESVRIASDLLSYGVQTIIFGRSRRGVEQMLQRLREISGDGAGEIRAYRSGYLPRQRREIEAGLRGGEVRTVVATTALELGIDIGGMDAALLAGYPGTIAGTWQQAGRAGRNRGASLSVLVTSANPLDQFLARHPDYFFERSPEQALLDPNNLLILLDHIRCAVYELPFQAGECYGSLSRSQTVEFLDVLQGAGSLHHSAGKYFWMSDEYPSGTLSLRSVPGKRILLRGEEDGKSKIIGEIDQASAHWMTHPGAIYLHEGEIYRVEDLDLERGVAGLQAWGADYYTEAKKETEVACLEVLGESPTPGEPLNTRGVKYFGEISVTSQVVGFHKIDWKTYEKLGYEELDLPPTTLHTTGYWLALGEEIVEELRDAGAWRSDPNDYGPRWDEIRHKVRARDHYRCGVCGIPENERQHHVHHKIPFRSFTNREEANRLENLITLCPRCHSRVENVVRVKSGLSGLAYTLGHLAPLLLMCDRHDLGLHADPKSPLGDGQPTVVIYEQIPAGVGFSARLYERHDELIRQAHELVSGCSCQDGCPSCVGPGGELGSGGKREVRRILEILDIGD